MANGRGFTLHLSLRIAAAARPRLGPEIARDVGVGIAHGAIGAVDVGADAVRRAARRPGRCRPARRAGCRSPSPPARAGIIGEARADRLAGDRVDDREGVGRGPIGRRQRRWPARGRCRAASRPRSTAPPRSRAHRLVEGAAVALEPLGELGRHHPRGGGEHDHVLVIVGRHARRDRPARIGDRGRPDSSARRKSGDGSCGSRRNRIRGRCPRCRGPGSRTGSSERSSAIAWPTAHILTCRRSGPCGWR